MTYLPSITQYALMRGIVAGQTLLNKFGRNPDVDTATDPEDIWTVGGTYTWQTAAQTLTVASSSTDDDGNPTTSVGAQTLTIVGLNASWVETTETITLNGTTSVVTSGTFIRVYRAYVATNGTYHSGNVGIITATFTSTGNTAFNILAGRGQTEMTHYTVPAGKTGYLLEVHAFVDSTKSANITLWRNENADDVTQPFGGSPRVVSNVDGLTGAVDIEYQGKTSFPAKTDIWATANNVSANDTSVALDYALYLVDA